MDSASLLSRESTTLSLANPQKGHFMALASNSDCWTIPPTRGYFDTRAIRGREVAVLLFFEIVTVGGWNRSRVRADWSGLRPVGRWYKHKTAPAPPAVRAPVFPHAFPVTEGLKPAIPFARRNEISAMTSGSGHNLPYLQGSFVTKVSAVCKKLWK
jgi:hypothetical protein